MMNIFEPCTLQIGDRNFLLMKEDYEVLSLEEWKNRMTIHLNADQHNSPFKRKSAKAKADSKENFVDSNSNCNDDETICDDNSDFEDIEDEESGKSSDNASVTSHSTTSSVEICFGKILYIFLLQFVDFCLFVFCY